MAGMPSGNNVDSFAIAPVFKKAGLIIRQMKCVPFLE
jgi:hypothetical protein